MREVMIAIAKGRPWNDSFLYSLMANLLFEQGNKRYRFHLAVKNQPFTGGEFEDAKYQRIAEARTELLEEALSSGMDYVWFLDDDMEFPANTFRRLSYHNLPFVSALGFMKKPPFYPTLFKAVSSRDPKTGEIHESYKHILDYGDDLLEVDGIGLFCALIKTEAVKKLRKPWFSSPELSAASHIGEDISFCRRCWEAGVKIYCDPSIKTGHLDFDNNCLITELEFKKWRGGEANV